MRILAGQFKGKNLFAGHDLSIRPTTNRIKEIIFAILDDFCKGKSVLDLFSGSGSLGFEAMSRGASKVTFVEREGKSIQVLKRNLQALPIEPHCVNIIKADALDHSKQSRDSFDLILMDPPFHYPPLQNLVNEIIVNNIMNKRGILVVHHEISNPLLEDKVSYKLIKQKKVGRSLISFILQEDLNV